MRLWVLLVFVAAVFAGDAEKYKGKAAAKGTKAEAEWKRYVLERKTFTDRDVTKLIKAYEDVVELFYRSLEAKEDDSLNGPIMLVARRLAKLRFEAMRRKRAKEPPRPKPKPKPKPGPKDEAPEKPEEKPVDKKPPKSKPEPDQPTPTDEPEFGRDSEGGWPELKEDKKSRKRGLQSLRNFIMHHYFANRKFSALVTRCSRCNGYGKIKIGKIPGTRRIKWGTCPNCKKSGGHLKTNVARRAFWLTMSPAYRGIKANRQKFFGNLAKWEEDPRLLPEFISNLAIISVDYRGLWAVVKYREKGTALINKRPRKFARQVERLFVRLGRRWFVYDEAADKDWFG